jgi:hypothetical protein
VRKWRIWGTLVPALLVLSVASALAAEPAPSNAEVLQRTTEDLTRAFEAGIPEDLSEGRRISMRPIGSSAFNESFEDAFAPILLDRGLDVWILDKDEEPSEGSLLLEYEVLRASLRYPKQSHGFLGLGTPKIQRRVELHVRGRLDEPDSGHLLWMDAPKAHYKDSFPVSQKAAVESGQPTWLGAKINVESGADSGAGFWEKIAILGLIGGVVTLYVSGAG